MNGSSKRALRRPFNWGVVLVMDSDSADVPLRLDDSGVARSPTGMAFAVRHAQDVEAVGLAPDEPVPPFVVEVRVLPGPPDRATTVEHEIRVDSGAITVGDAEAEERLEVAPGEFLVSILLDDPAHAEHVTIWLTPEGAVGPRLGQATER
ncbi:MAG: hypothetical protein ACRD03_13810 [Acidimicrobiales bacterium]